MPGSSNERLGPENKAHMAVCTLQPKVYWSENMVKFLSNASSRLLQVLPSRDLSQNLDKL
jgi:hypothetical protein